jgi:hypothetical protein
LLCDGTPQNNHTFIVQCSIMGFGQFHLVSKMGVIPCFHGIRKSILILENNVESMKLPGTWVRTGK